MAAEKVDPRAGYLVDKYVGQMVGQMVYHVTAYEVL